MTFDTLLAFGGAFLCLSLGLGALYKEPRAGVSRAFALGMLVLALREVCVGLGSQATLPQEALRWQRLGWMVAVVLPGSWLPFSLSFARRDSRDLLARWRWGMVGALALPLLGMTVFSQALLVLPAGMDERMLPVLPLGWAGYGLGIFGLSIAVVILVNLEGSLRAAAGTKRWQIKFMLLGVGSVFAGYIYTMSQTLLFTAVTPIARSVDSWAVLVANVLILTALARSRLSYAPVVLTQTTLSNSLTVLLVGIYLLAVGVLTKVISAFGGNQLIPLSTFFVFLALVGLAIVLLAEQPRQKFKRFVSRHVYQARHDYRHVWMTFTERTAEVVDVKALCAVVTGLVSETFGTPAVTIWLWHDDAPGALQLGGSTEFSENQTQPPGLTAQGAAELVDYLRQRRRLVDFAAPSDTPGKALRQAVADGWRRARMRYAVPLMAGQAFVGMLTLHERPTTDPFTLEDENLLTTLAAQAATSLHTLQLTQRLVRAQQMEAFQTLSAFFVHDLKNLASKLSMTLQTLPVHYDNPAFRKDLLELIGDGVAKIDTMCGRLSTLTQRLELHCVETDLNALVRATLADLQHAVTVPLLTDLQPVPRLQVDAEQLQKVLVNLVLNAHDAVAGHGEIRLSTERRNGSVVLVVRDTGCGMSREFMEQSLFQPFRTTKRRGLGIGLFQSKMIVEAHQGKIEVESEAGKGSTFRVLLKV